MEWSVQCVKPVDRRQARPVIGTKGPDFADGQSENPSAYEMSHDPSAPRAENRAYGLRNGVYNDGETSTEEN